MCIHIDTEYWLEHSFKYQSCHHIETSQLTYRANQMAGFYMMATLGFLELMCLINIILQPVYIYIYIYIYTHI